MTADHRKPTYQAQSNYDPLAEMIALTTADTAVDTKTAYALADMERLSQAGVEFSTRNSAGDAAALAEFEALVTPAHRAAHSDKSGLHLAEMTALATSDTAADSKTASALAEMERLSQPGAMSSTCNSAADVAALAEFEALSTPEPRKKPSPDGGDAAYPEPRYSVQVERALYQSQIDLVNAFRPSPRKRRRDYGYDR